MTTRLRRAGPPARLFHPAALIVAGFLVALWPYRRRMGESQTAVKAHADQRLRTSEAILDNAATICHVGAWQLVLPAKHITWSRELCVMLEVAPAHQPSFDEAMAFYLPADRRVLGTALADCAATGLAFALGL